MEPCCSARRTMCGAEMIWLKPMGHGESWYASSRTARGTKSARSVRFMASYTVVERTIPAFCRFFTNPSLLDELHGQSGSIGAIASPLTDERLEGSHSFTALGGAAAPGGFQLGLSENGSAGQSNDLCGCMSSSHDHLRLPRHATQLRTWPAPSLKIRDQCGQQDKLKLWSNSFGGSRG